MISSEDKLKWNSEAWPAHTSDETDDFFTERYESLFEIIRLGIYDY